MMKSEFKNNQAEQDAWRRMNEQDAERAAKMKTALAAKEAAKVAERESLERQMEFLREANAKLHNSPSMQNK